MAAKKKCVSCGKKIPETAMTCVFCAAKQDVAPPPPAVETPAATTEAGATASPDATPASPEATATSPEATAASPAAPAQESAAAMSVVTADAAPAPAPTTAPAGGEAEAEKRATQVTPAAVAAVGRAPTPSSMPAVRAAPSQTHSTLIGMKVDTAALEAAVANARAADAAKSEGAAKPAEGEAKADAAEKPAKTEEKAAEKPAKAAEKEEPRAPRRPMAWSALGRTVMGIAGLVLLALYVSSYKVMVSFAGPQLFLQQYSLIGGLLLVAGGLLRLPPRVRAGLAALVGAVPLFLVGPSVGGFGGWRGMAAGLVFLVLPGALLLRARATGSKVARGLVAMAVALIGILYAAPADGVMPVSAAWALLSSGSVGEMMTGAIFLAPLVLALLALTAFAGRDSTGFGTLWACLVLLVAPGAIIVAGMAADESSLVYVGVALAAAGATAAVGLAQLLDSTPQPA